MIAPLTVAKLAMMACTKITEAARSVSANEVQCQRLAARAQIVSKIVRELINKLMLEEVDAEKGESKKVLLQALESLKNTLEEALSLVESFSPQKQWYHKIFDAAFTQSKFPAVYSRLEQDIQQLHLGLSVHQLINPVEDLKDQEADYQRLIQRQDEILRLNQEANLSHQQLAMDEKERHHIMMQQLESMKLSLANMRPTAEKKSAVSEKLLVRFHDLAIDRLLWNGERSKVYLGRWLEQRVAIKVLNAQFTPQEQEEFIREINIMKELRSEFVMPLYAACTEPGRACLIMRYMRHGSLRQLLDTGVFFTGVQKDQLVLDIALGLYYLHSKDIIHRDLKTANVLVDEVGRARISDFGLSRSNSGKIETLDNPDFDFNYLSPEVLEGTGAKEFITKANDVYAFGSVMWEILTGKKLYAGLTKEKIINKIFQGEHEEIPAEVEPFYREILMECWKKDPILRPSIKTVTERLRQYQSDPLKEVNTFVFWDPVQKKNIQPNSEKDEKEKQSSLGLSTNPFASFSASSSAFSTESDSTGKIFFMAGKGFELDKQPQKALASYQKAAEVIYLPDSSSRAADLTAETLFMAGKGFEKSGQMEKAMKYYQTAANLNFSRAKVTQARHYLEGKCGVLKDERKARQLLKAAAEQGDVAAMRMVGILYEEGRGVPIDLTRAKACYKEAVEAGDQDAQRRLLKLEEKAIPHMSARP